ncbi:pyruvate kinase [Caldalkalibacillus salinus]|uniref:pyruvate kinase n=1 Tax=Caldalkalibacillus salinus TaxID=2803787 RepID=UPI001922F672|nr:pyruvate kinase [Caldalkalibacillus salinus]
MRKTKIVGTIGPASESVASLKQLFEAGLNVTRLNFSHGDFDEHGQRIQNIRQAIDEAGKNVAILLDTKGPEIRTGVLEQEPIELVEGDTLVVTTEDIKGNANRISVTYTGLVNDINPGSKILIDDGLIELQVEKIEGTDIITTILNGGELKSRKGVNVPGVSVNLPGITEKDENDIRFGLSQGIDFIAASFVRKASDILEIRKILEEEEQEDVQIIAKIENQEGYDNLDEILEVADGIMVARGDLGVEVPAEDVPLMQKAMIKKCNEVGKPVITATQMLDSMQRNPRPTRAEVGDVANAIFDGTDAVMLSGETAAGDYPLESVKTMAKIAERTEAAIEYREWMMHRDVEQQNSITGAISQAVCNAALDLDAAAILTPTESGYTARMVSRYRPKSCIIAVTNHEKVVRKLALVWGVHPVLADHVHSTDEMLDSSVDSAVQTGFVKHGDLVVITAGVPVRESGTTNLMKIHVVGDIAAKGQGIGKKAVTGKVVVAKDAAEAKAKMTPGSILVTVGTDKDMIESLEQCAAVITEEGGLTSHAAVVGINVGVPVIVGVDNATTTFKDGDEITVDALRGHIYTGHAKVL